MALSRRERREQRRRLLKEERQGLLRSEQPVTVDTHAPRAAVSFFDRHYKKLLILPMLLLLLAIGQIAYQVATTGEFLNKGVSLEGGVVITVPTKDANPQDIQSFLGSRFPGDEIDVRSTTEFGVQNSIIIATDNLEAADAMLSALDERIPGASQSASSETTGSSLGGSFFQQALIAMLIAFAFMAAVVFISFRKFIPSMAVIFAAFADIVETVAVVNLMGMNVSTAGIAALLMLIGYSVDTDILLTSRVLRSKEGTVTQRIASAAKTGLLMTGTAIIAVTVGLLLGQSIVIKEIMTIIFIGLVFDIINTWVQNAGMLKWYLEGRKEAD